MEVGLRLRVASVVVEEFDNVLGRHGEDDNVVRRRRASAVEEWHESLRRILRHPLQPRLEDDSIRFPAVQKLLHGRVRAVPRQPVRVRIV
mmetsp:Transcript_51358/g.60021  ORF Transcript_51358/g.60021 Transcript_51358/m.60021 type:complete len:90 (-) Transcript_51358:532-801(-)